MAAAESVSLTIDTSRNQPPLPGNTQASGVYGGYANLSLVQPCAQKQRSLPVAIQSRVFLATQEGDFLMPCLLFDAAQQADCCGELSSIIAGAGSCSAMFLSAFAFLKDLNESYVPKCSNGTCAHVDTGRAKQVHRCCQPDGPFHLQTTSAPLRFNTFRPCSKQPLGLGILNPVQFSRSK